MVPCSTINVLINIVNRVIIVKFMGGLGNQMFQYAAGRRLALLHNAQLKLDIAHLNDPRCNTPRDYALKHLSINAEIATTVETNSLRRKGEGQVQRLFSLGLCSSARKRALSRDYREPHFHFDPHFLVATDDCYLDGYWQSEKYFADIKDIIHSEFRVIYPLRGRNQELAELIRATESFSLHVRRGDYVSNPTTSKYHGICGLKYYELAIELIVEKMTQPRAFIFSDDPEWAKMNLKFSFPTTFICHNGSCCYEDLRLMSLCRHNIIANSSFSWWGAWLNGNSDKIVVAPARWFNNTEIDINDLLPESWMRVPA